MPPGVDSLPAAEDNHPVVLEHTHHSVQVDSLLDAQDSHQVVLEHIHHAVLVDSLLGAQDSHQVVLEHIRFVALEDGLPAVGPGTHCMQEVVLVVVVVVVVVVGLCAFYSFSCVHFHLHFRKRMTRRICACGLQISNKN